MDINAKVASRIKALRSEKGYKAEIVAQELEMSKAAYSQLENGKIDISILKRRISRKLPGQFVLRTEKTLFCGPQCNGSIFSLALINRHA